MPRFKITYILIPLIAMAAACSGQIDRYSEFRSLPEKGWAYGDSISFNAMANVAGATDMRIAVRHNDSFLYRNLWV